MRITQLGEPVLRQKAKAVSVSELPALRKLAPAVLQTMMKASGVGIAANQVDISKQFFIMASHPNPRYPGAKHMKPIFMINPKLKKASKKRLIDWEGCLSIPGLRAQVPRAAEVWVSYTDLLGKQREIHFKGFVARIFQHEFDHINGMVYLDRVENTRSFCMEGMYRQRVKK